MTQSRYRVSPGKLIGYATGIGVALFSSQVFSDEPDEAQLQRQLQALQERVDSLEASGQSSSDWQLYGSLRVAYGWLDDGNRGDLNVFDRGSRIGVRGTYAPMQDSGSWAPKAFWQVESGIDVDAGDGTLASRDTFAGLMGPWGAVRAGFFASPARVVGRSVDQVQSRVGDNRNLLRTDNLTGGQNGRSPGWDMRIGNAIEYATPRIAGVTARVQYSSHFDDNFGQFTDTAPAISTSLIFEQGPLWLAAAMEKIDRDSAEVPGDEGDPTLYRLAAIYDLGPLALSGLYQRAENQQGNDKWDRDTFGVGAGFSLSQRTFLKGQIYHAEAMDALKQTQATMAAAEIEHRIYPRTRLYFSLAHTDNGKAAQFQTTRGVIRDGPVGENSTSASLLLRQDF